MEITAFALLIIIAVFYKIKKRLINLLGRKTEKTYFQLLKNKQVLF